MLFKFAKVTGGIFGRRPVLVLVYLKEESVSLSPQLYPRFKIDFVKRLVKALLKIWLDVILY